ncbi:MAG: hypothetical protein ABI024_05870, partial [Vicinamibacterales bacterium]
VLPPAVDVFPGIATALTISGGAAPYRAFSSNTAVLAVPTNVAGNVVTLLATSVAINTPVTITIQDAVGQTVQVIATVRPTPAVTPPPLVVLPNEVTVSKGIPVTLTISGGLAPYQAYSTNPIALPVTQSVAGSSLILVANGVSANTNAVVIIQDSAGQTVNVTVHILADSATPPPPLVLLPSPLTVFSGSPAQLTVNGGTPPYTAISSNPAVLPVTQVVAGTTIPLFAANVSAATTVTITVIDSDNKTAAATVIVQPSTLLNSLTVTPNRVDCGVSSVCSGQTAVAAVTVTAPGGGGIANRQVRFDVIAGDYAILNGSTQVSSLTVTSDAVGSAKVVLFAFVNAPTQVALIRATDVTTGNTITGSFIIAQFTNGSAILSVLPSSVVLTGPDDTHCSSGIPVSYYVFGGTPPYRVVANLPTLVNLTTSTVAKNGDAFVVITIGCVALETFVITDATGRTVTATLSSVLGPAAGGGGGGGGGGSTSCAASPPAPGCPVVNPSSLTITACSPLAGSSATALITGGTGPYTVGLLAGGAGVFAGISGGSTLTVSRTAGLATQAATARVTASGFFVDVSINITNFAANCP